MQTYLDCVRDVVEEECGSDAVAYTDEVVRLVLTPVLDTLESVGCHIGKTYNVLECPLVALIANHANRIHETF